MLIGFSKHGKGSGADVVGYITDGADVIEYVSGRKKTGKARDPAPVVIRGEPKVARHLIDLTPFQWRYTSAMMSFSPGERITPEMERRVMDEFERCAFAGLDRSRYYTLWVRHTDGPGDCHHLHVVTPRMDLLSGKSLNIAPPGKASRELFDTLRSKMSAELGLSDPDDPRRVQAVRLPQHVAKLRARQRANPSKNNEDARLIITRHLEEKVRDGLIKNRDDVAGYLRNTGFTITREGKDYLTIHDDKTGQRVRLRGGLYDRDRCPKVLSRIRDGDGANTFSNPERVSALEEKLGQLVEARARHHRERYGSNIETQAVRLKEEFHDQFREQVSGSGSGNGTELRGTRAESQRTFDHIDEGTRRLEHATRNLVHSSRVLGEAIERARAGHWDRETDRNLISKYGAPVAIPSRSREREREFEREMEREFA